MAEIDKPGSFYLGRPHDIAQKKSDFKPLLYDFVAGTAQAWEVAPYFQQLLAPYNINFLQVPTTALMQCDKNIQVASGPS